VMAWDNFSDPPVVSGQIHESASDWLINEDTVAGFTHPHRFTTYFH